MKGLALIRKLTRSDLTVTDAEDLEFHRRDFYRLLRALQAAGLPLARRTELVAGQRRATGPSVGPACATASLARPPRPWKGQRTGGEADEHAGRSPAGGILRAWEVSGAEVTLDVGGCFRAGGMTTGISLEELKRRLDAGET